jgi:hypothetical protein
MQGRHSPEGLEHRNSARSGYWYHLAMPGLVLDRAPSSVTLEVPSYDSNELAQGVSSRGGGQNESF